MPSLFGIGGGSGGQGPSGSMNSAQLEMAVAELVSHPTKRCTSPILIFFCVFEWQARHGHGCVQPAGRVC